jgi:hypothetical protein
MQDPNGQPATGQPTASIETAKDIQQLKEHYDLDHALRAAIPILYVSTFEEFKLVRVIRSHFRDKKVNLFEWTQTQGIRRLVEKDDRLGREKAMPDTASLNQALAKIEEASQSKEINFFFLLDPPLGQGGAGDFSWVVRKLRDLAAQLRSTLTRLIIVCPNMSLPFQLSRDVQRIDLPLPTEDELQAVLDHSIEEGKGLPEQQAADPPGYDAPTKRRIRRAALGLTESQASDTFAKSLAALNRIDAKYVVAEKEKLIKTSSNDILEFYHPRESLDQVCGIEHLQSWLSDIERATMTEEARKHGVDFPRGMLLIGIPGCGKSMTVKAVGNTWNLPLIRMDVQRAFSKYLGETESHIDQALRFVEVIAPCVLWIDEVEKGFAGYGGDNTGTTDRIFGKFLTWMQEHEAPVFLCCTANRLESLPVEFSRPGRFTKIWFIGYPNADARRKLFEVHFHRAFNRHPALDQVVALVKNPEFEEVVRATAKWTGAEVEMLCQNALRACELARQATGNPGADVYAAALTPEVVLETVARHRPMSVMQADAIEKIMDWVRVRDVACAGDFEGTEQHDFVSYEGPRRGF